MLMLPKALLAIGKKLVERVEMDCMQSVQLSYHLSGQLAGIVAIVIILLPKI